MGGGAPVRRATTALLCALVACRPHETEGVPEAHPVHCTAAIAQTAHDEITLRGTIAARPDKDSVVAAEVAGRVRAIKVREGDSVLPGALVAEIECGPHLDAAKQARAGLDSATAALVEAKAAREREAHLVERGIAAKQALEAATAREAAAKSAVDVERARVDDANLVAGRCSVRSSQSGIVVRVLRRQGDIVDGTSATAIAEVADPSAAEAVLAAGADDLARIAPGQKVKVAFMSQTGTSYDGVVLSAPPSVDRVTGLGTVRVTLAAGAKSVLGALVSATIDLGSDRPVIAVPRAAVRSAGGDKSEVLVCGVTARVVAVKTGGALPGDLVAVEGIAVGDRIAIDGALGVEDGAKIREVTP